MYPNLGSFSVSNIASSFRIDGGNQTRLNDFIGEKFAIQVTGNDVESNFYGVNLEGQLVSHTLTNQIGGNMIADFNFTFDLETLRKLGRFRYYRFLGTNSDNSATNARQAIKEIHLIDTAGTTYPTTDFADDGSDLDSGGSDITGPYVQGGLTVTAGYSANATYGPHEAFGANNMWWTLGLSDSSLNYLDVDFGSTKVLSQIQVLLNENHHYCTKLRILGSNSSDFSSFEVFAEIDYQSSSNVIDLGNTTLTVDNGKKITVSAGGSTSVSNI
jgi:hypothetical protein